MKLLLWQQFSGNHSSSYRILGVFRTEVQAQQAQHTLNEMMLKVLAFNEPPERNDDNSPTPIETEYARAHHIEWEKTISWLHHPEGPLQLVIDRHVARFGHHVIIASHDEPITGEDKRVQALIKTLDAEVYHSTDDTYFKVGFVCHAPDQATAQTIYKALLGQRDTPNKIPSRLPPPWTLYHPLGMQLLQGLTEPQYLALAEAWQLWHNIIQAHTDGESDTFARQIRRFFHEARLIGRLHGTWARMSLPDSTRITRQGQEIHFEDDEQNIRMIHAMPAIHMWLVTLGCQVTYIFSQESR